MCTAHVVLTHLVGAGLVRSGQGGHGRNPGLWRALWRLGNAAPTPQALGARYWRTLAALLAQAPMPSPFATLPTGYRY